MDGNWDDETISSGNPNDSHAQDPLFPVIAEAVTPPQLRTLFSASLPALTLAVSKAPPSSQLDNQNPPLEKTIESFLSGQYSYKARIRF